MLFLLVSSATASAEEATKRVLVVTSYDMNLPGVVSFHQAMRASIREGSNARVEFFYEFQENTRIPIDKYEDYMVGYLRHKYEGENFDLVIALGGPALNLLLKHEAVLFTDTPKLFYFFEEPEETLRGVWPHATGVWSRVDVSQTLDVALTLQPETRKVFVISSSAVNGNPMREQAQNQLRKYEGKLELVYLDNLTMEELRGKVAALPEDSVVLYLGFSRDSTGNTYTGPEALSMFAPASSAPVYGISETYLGAGIVGGSLIDFEALGRRTGEMGQRILSGAKPADIAPETVPNVVAFDWRELRRWGISEARLPPGSDVRFRELTVWERYRWYIVGAVLLFTVETALIAALLMGRRRRLRLNAELRKSEERFVSIFYNSPLRMYIVRRRDGLILHVNDAWIRETGYSREETINRSLTDWASWLDAERREHLYRQLNEGPDSFSFEGPMITKAGEKRFTQVSAQSLELDSERCYVFAANDITERKRAEEALRRSEENFRKAFEASPASGGIIRARDRRHLKVNSAFVRMFGYTTEEAVGKTAAELGIWPVSREQEELWQKLRNKKSIKDYETRVYTKSGERMDVLLYVETIEMSGEQCVMASLIDITKRKEAEEELRASHEQLRALSERLRKAKDEEGIRIARELHDELGAALTSLKWSLTRLHEDCFGGANAGMGGDTQSKIGGMVSLVDATINTVRRISSELRPGVLEDLGLIPAIEWHAQQVQANTGIVCRFESQVENVELSRERATTVFRIFQEAMTNVLRHAGATRVNILVEEDDDEFVLEVSDNGRGITDSEKLGTSSLGLLGMRERAHSVGGRVEINATPGKGTTLIVRIPLPADGRM
jgi:PAS domain S-box-containing protein